MSTPQPTPQHFRAQGHSATDALHPHADRPQQECLNREFSPHIPRFHSTGVCLHPPREPDPPLHPYPALTTHPTHVRNPRTPRDTAAGTRALRKAASRGKSRSFLFKAERGEASARTHRSSFVDECVTDRTLRPETDQWTETARRCSLQSAPRRVMGPMSLCSSTYELL